MSDKIGLLILQIVLMIIGFVLLVKGADWFVEGAAGVARKFRISSFVIGLTIVALGTSAPEAATSIISAVSEQEGAKDVIVGNVLGSNIINILLILGISSLIANIPVHKGSRKIELPILIAITLLFGSFTFLGNNFTWWEGLILLGLYCSFMVYTIIMAVRQKTPAEELSSTATLAVGQEEQPNGFFGKISKKIDELMEHTWFLFVVTVVGLAMVVGGAFLVVDSATIIARDIFNIPVMIVSLTVVAFGTSLPELVTSITAAKKNEMDICTGNIIGSNIANLLFVAAFGFICSGSSGVPYDKFTLTDTAVSLVAALVLWLFSFKNNNRLGKAAGITMLVLLVLYYVYLVLRTIGIIAF